MQYVIQLRIWLIARQVIHFGKFLNEPKATSKLSSICNIVLYVYTHVFPIIM